MKLSLKGAIYSDNICNDSGQEALDILINSLIEFK